MSTLHPSVEELEASIRSLVIPCKRLAPPRKPGGVVSPCQASPVASNRIGAPNVKLCQASRSKPRKLLPNMKIISDVGCSNFNVNNGNDCACKPQPTPSCSNPVPLRVTNVLGQCLQINYALPPRDEVFPNGRDPCINVLGQRHGVWDPPCCGCSGEKTNTIGQTVSQCPPPSSHCQPCCPEVNTIGQRVAPSPQCGSNCDCICPSYNVIGQRVTPYKPQGHC